MKKLALTAACFALSASAAPARENYLDGFLRHWTGTFSNQSSIVMVAIGVGIVAIFIITRSKSVK